MKKRKWIKRRHAVVTKLAYAILAPISKFRYGIRVERFESHGDDNQYIILFNHQTAFDQFFVGMAFDTPIYYVASEDLFSNGVVSSLIRWLVAPIPIKKQTTDISAVRNCMRVANEGGTIAIAPEGNRTYSGKTEYMNPAIAPLVRKLDLPLVLFKIEGGYGVHPRWSDGIRRGKMRAYASRVIRPEVYNPMSNDELLELIKRELTVNEANADNTYKSKKSAEYIERVMYVCPFCGLSEFESHGDITECKKCHRKIRYLPTTELEGVGFEFPYKFANDWYNAQCDFINSLDISRYGDNAIYTDTVQISEVIVYKHKKILRKSAEIALYHDKIDIGDSVFKFDDVSAVTVLGRNKLNVYKDGRVYQFKGDKRFNAVKYVNIYHRYKNMRENNNGKFLGL